MPRGRGPLADQALESIVDDLYYLAGTPRLRAAHDSADALGAGGRSTLQPRSESPIRGAAGQACRRRRLKSPRALTSLPSACTLLSQVLADDEEC